MAQATVRIAQSTRGTLRALAREEEESMQAVLAKAIEAYRRMKFIERVNAGYADLRRDEGAWAEHQRELQSFEGTLGDLLRL